MPMQQRVQSDSTCPSRYNAGTIVSLRSAPAAGNSFVNWGGAFAVTVNTYALTAKSNLSAQANFSK